MNIIRLLFKKIIGEYLCEFEVVKDCLSRTQNILIFKNDKFNYIMNLILLKDILWNEKKNFIAGYGISNSCMCKWLQLEYTKYPY